MTPISLMPPVDSCSSCEGRKAELRAQQIGDLRAQKAELKSESTATALNSAKSPSGAPLTEAAGRSDEPISLLSVAGATKPLLAPELAVQVALARPETETGAGDAETRRLRGAQSYGAS